MTARGGSVRERVRPALVASRVTVRQLLRKQYQSTLLLGIIVGFNVFLAALLSGVAGPGAYDLGRALAVGDGLAATQARDATLSGLVLVSVMHTLGAASDAKYKHHRVAFLTATSTGAVVTALLTRRVVASLTLFGPALVVAAVAFGAGTGVPVNALSVGLVSLWFVTATAVCTLPFGLAVNWLLAGYDLSGNARLGLGTVVLGVFYLALFGRRVIADLLSVTPVAWAGDLLLVGVAGGEADPLLAAGFALASLVAVAVTGASCVRLAEAAWFSEPGVADTDDESDRTLPDFGTGRLCGVVPSGRTAALVALTWRRTRRTPKVLFYVYPSAFVGFVMVERLVVNGPFTPALVPVVVCFAGGTAAGSAFTLNPLGTEGDALPTLLTSGAGAGRIVRAKAVAAAIPGGLVVVGLALGLGVGLAVPPAVLVATVVYAVALVALAGVLSQALGVHYPPDHEGLLGGSVTVPDKSASMLYTVGMVTVALPGFAGLGQYALTGAVVGPVLVAGVGSTVAAAVGGGVLSYRHAVGRLDAYSVE